MYDQTQAYKMKAAAAVRSSFVARTSVAAQKITGAHAFAKGVLRSDVAEGAKSMFPSILWVSPFGEDGRS